jgi:glycosyltransferase involved in cell wall biosynthesis
MKIIITSPSLNVNTNVSGVSAVTNFIIKLNTEHEYIHFEIGKKDAQGRGLLWFLNLLRMYCQWFYLMCTTNYFIHFNFPVDKRSVMRDVPLMLLAKLFRKRLVIHLHGGEYLLNESVPGWIKYMIKLALQGRHPVICLSIAEKRVVTTKYGAINAIELPNSIDLTDAEGFHREIADDELPVLLFLGRIHLDKGIAYIYEALATLKQHGLNFKFVMAGKGPAQDEYDAKFKALLGDRYEFKGIVSGDSKTAAFKECNIFLLPSFWEGLPIALLEAMSFGMVPVTTDVGAMKTVVISGTNGLIVETYSAESIVNAITSLSGNHTIMRKLSANARKLVFIAYNPHKYIDTLNKIYQYE